MERILSDSEKIRRAEEIYARRRGMEVEEPIEKQGNHGIYKFSFRLLLLLNIIVAVLCVQNKEIIFKDEFLNQFYMYSQEINQKVNAWINQLKDEKTSGEQQDLNVEENKNVDENQVVENTADSTENEENVDNTPVIAKEETIPDKIKSSYSFIKPIEGTVTSFFGDRESAYQNVTGNHKGIDIGAKTGTIIKASMEGTVTQVSSEGDYRKSYENRKR